VLDYDLEAAHYDRTRGGAERARAAAGAVLELVPAGCAVLVDVACGTGIVSELLRAPVRTVVGVDRSAGMLALARPRLAGGGDAGCGSPGGGGVARGDATRLPVASGSVDAVTFMWLLHLVDAATVAAAIAEAARVLAPGGTLLVVDFAAHEREELRTTDAHIRLGFEDEVMAGWFASAGLKIDHVEHLEGGELTVTLWRGVKAAIRQRRAA